MVRPQEGRVLTVSDAMLVGAPPEAVYGLVADPTQYPRWSPENTGAHLEPGTVLQVGDSFVGSNTRGPLRWATRCVVTAAEPGVRFAFSARDWGLRTPSFRIPNAAWEYHLTPAGGGTRVTLTWTDERGWPDPLAAVVDRVVTGGHTFAAFQRRNIAVSLAGLKRVAEGVRAA